MIAAIGLLVGAFLRLFHTHRNLLPENLLCSAKIQWSRRIAHFQGSHLPEVSIRILGGFDHAVSSLLIGAAVRSCLIINPILFRVCHAATSGNLACWSGLVERTGKRTLAECLGSVAALTRIPLINDHLDRHIASPHAARALFLICPRCESPMTSFAVDGKRRWNTAPRRRLSLFLNPMCSDLQIADLIKFNGLQTRIGNRQRIPGHGVTGSEMVFGVCALAHAQDEFSGLTSDVAAYP